MSIDRQLAQHFRCTKCHSQGASIKRIAATGTGLSKLMDIQHNKYIALSCQNCGYTELYNPDFLEGKNNLGTIIDILFGG